MTRGPVARGRLVAWRTRHHWQDGRLGGGRVGTDFEMYTTSTVTPSLERTTSNQVVSGLHLEAVRPFVSFLTLFPFSVALQWQATFPLGGHLPYRSHLVYRGMIYSL